MRSNCDRIDAQLRQVAARVGLEVTPLPLKKEPRLKEICDRLTKLWECGLESFEVEVLNLLERNVVLTRPRNGLPAHYRKASWNHPGLTI